MHFFIYDVDAIIKPRISLNACFVHWKILCHEYFHARVVINIINGGWGVY